MENDGRALAVEDGEHPGAIGAVEGHAPQPQVEDSPGELVIAWILLLAKEKALSTLVAPRRQLGKDIHDAVQSRAGVHEAQRHPVTRLPNDRNLIQDVIAPEKHRLGSEGRDDVDFSVFVLGRVAVVFPWTLLVVALAADDDGVWASLQWLPAAEDPSRHHGARIQLKRVQAVSDLRQQSIHGGEARNQ